jgi:hypothetical protein
MSFFSFLKYTFIMFEAYLVTSCGPPFENHCYIVFILTAYLNNKLTDKLTYLSDGWMDE